MSIHQLLVHLCDYVAEVVERVRHVRAGLLQGLVLGDGRFGLLARFGTRVTKLNFRGKHSRDGSAHPRAKRLCDSLVLQCLE